MIKVYSQQDDLIYQGLNILIYGDPGIGKTTLANTAPNPLVLDFDRGSHRASHRRGNVVQFDSWSDIKNSQRELQELISKHDSIIIDTVGTMIELMQMYLQTSQPALARNGIKLWGETKKIFAEVPIRVEYQLTSLGYKYLEKLIVLSEWVTEEMDTIVENRKKYDKK